MRLFVVGACLTAFIVCASCSDGGGKHTSPTTATTVVTPPPTTVSDVTAAALIGTAWRPVSIAGYSPPLTSPPLSSAHLSFGPNQTWNGYDGCNYIAGTYRLRSGGSFQLVEHASTLVGCRRRIPLPTTAVRVELRHGRITFYARNGHQLAEYERLAPAETTANPQVEVMPNSGLVDGQKIRVKVTGFGIGGKVWLSECAAAADANNLGCGPQLAQQTLLVTDNRRSGSVSFVVRNRAATGSHESRDLRPCASGCVLVATAGQLAGYLDLKNFAYAGLKFGHG